MEAITSRKSLLLIMYLIITSCTMDCVEPGLQSRNTSVSIDVPVYKDSEVDKIHWIDSGQVINKGEKIKFTINGSVNFCPLKESKNPLEILVPAVFCANGLIPNYNNKLIDNDGLDERELCGNIGFGNNEFYSNKRYVKTEIKVNPGDKLSFSLVPREIVIDHNNQEGKGISFDDNCYKTEKGNEKDKVTIQDMLDGGTFFCERNGKRIEIKFPQLRKENIKKRKVLVGNGYTPYDNKVHFNKDYIKNESPWINGALVDLRRTKIGIDKLCNVEEKKRDFNEISKYSSYELNCYYQNICYNKEGMWNFSIGAAEGRKNCVSSIRYKKYDRGNECDMCSHLKNIEDNLKKIEEKENNTNFTSSIEQDSKDISWAEALIAKIGNLDDQDTAKGTQCLPNEKGAKGDSVCSQINNKFENYSIRLNYDYIVNNKVETGSSLMLAIADYGYYSLNRGGYHVKITRSCNFDSGKKLYIYLGNNPPKDLSILKTGDFLKEVERLNKITEDNINYFIIDESHFKTEESKKIHFGIDVSNIKKDDIVDKNGKYYEDNKYVVNLFLKRRINNFISSTINKIFDFIKEEGKNEIKIPYEGYRKGLLQGVRALLTLYVIFTAVGYMLGTIQLKKFDFVVRMLKIAFVVFAFSDKSWEFFSKILSGLFINGSIHLIDSFSGYIGEEGKKFAFLDLTVGVLFTRETWLKFLSLMLSGPFGFIAFLIILKATFTFLKCIISATFKYVVSTILVAFLLSLTPLFIVFILFQQTKGLIDNWIKTLAYISLQPVILFSSLSLLNQLMYSVLYNLTNFSACYQCLISIKYLSYDLCIMKSILPLGYNPSTSVDVALSTWEKSNGYFAALPIDLIQAFIYLIISGAMEAFISISEIMAQILFSSGFGVAQSVAHVARNVSQAILLTVGLDDKTQGMIQNIKQKISKDRTKVEVKQSEKKDEYSKKIKKNFELKS